MENIDFKSGDRIFVRGNLIWYKPMSWLSALIRFFAKIKYNHTGIIVSNWNETFINEAVAKGILANHIQELKGKYIRVDRCKQTIDVDYFCKKANSKLGTPYDHKGLLLDQLIFQLFHKWTGHTHEFAESKMYCYEYGAWCYNWLFPEWWEINPVDYLNNDNFEVIFEGKFL
jgi:hypothetical protein